jgi:uncharacterized membrane protein YhaH (DUF805 family)
LNFESLFVNPGGRTPRAQFVAALITLLAAWLRLVPTVLALVAFGIWLGYFSLGSPIDAALPSAALALAAGFALWGCIGKGKALAAD